MVYGLLFMDAPAQLAQAVSSDSTQPGCGRLGTFIVHLNTTVVSEETLLRNKKPPKQARRILCS